MSDKRIQSVDRALDILELYLSSPEELSVKEISEAMGLSKSTVHGLIKTLEHRGYLQQNPGNTKYRLGMKLFSLGNVVGENLDIRKIARPVIQRLVDKIKETVHLAVLTGNDIVYTEKVEGPGALRMYSQVGKRVFVHCTGVGKVILAYQDDDVVESMLSKETLKAFTPHTLTDKEELKSQLKVIREQGYALDNEEIELGLRCVAAPIYNHQGKVIASISCAGPSIRMSDDQLESKIQAMKEAALEISRLLGYQN
jgi:DNA-binding IclR family transcriptional regulator